MRFSVTVKAFHIKFDDEKLDSNIQLWDVEVLKVSYINQETIIN